jgi:hypothetical protein
MFVQIIEGTTNDRDALIAAGDAWQQEVRPGAIGYLGATSGVASGGRAFHRSLRGRGVGPGQQRPARAGRLVREAPRERVHRDTDLHGVQ